MNSLATIRILILTISERDTKKLALDRKQAKDAGNDLNILAARHEVNVASVHLALWSLFTIGHFQYRLLCVRVGNF